MNGIKTADDLIRALSQYDINLPIKIKFMPADYEGQEGITVEKIEYLSIISHYMRRDNHLRKRK